MDFLYPTKIEISVPGGEFIDKEKVQRETDTHIEIKSDQADQDEIDSDEWGSRTPESKTPGIQNVVIYGMVVCCEIAKKKIIMPNIKHSTKSIPRHESLKRNHSREEDEYSEKDDSDEECSEENDAVHSEEENLKRVRDEEGETAGLKDAIIPPSKKTRFAA